MSKLPDSTRKKDAWAGEPRMEGQRGDVQCACRNTGKSVSRYTVHTVRMCEGENAVLFLIWLSCWACADVVGGTQMQASISAFRLCPPSPATLPVECDACPGTLFMRVDQNAPSCLALSPRRSPRFSQIRTISDWSDTAETNSRMEIDSCALLETEFGSV